MSALTIKLVNRTVATSRPDHWPGTLSVVADRLVAAYGVPTLGNFRDPVKEVFYILLSARTTDPQYRRTYLALRARFSCLADLASASPEEVVPCIVGGGLANKRATQVRRTAGRLLADLGLNPSRRLKSMAAAEAYSFLTGLPGMGPKSALCVMMFSLGFDVFPVDVNVQRVAARMGAIPAGLKHYQAQQRLPALVPEGRCKELHVGLVVHGRKVCLARTPRCEDCAIRDLCDFGKRLRGTKEAAEYAEAAGGPAGGHAEEGSTAEGRSGPGGWPR